MSSPSPQWFVGKYNSKLDPIDIEGFPRKPWVLYSATSTKTGEIYVSKFDTKFAPGGRWYQINLLEPDSAPQHVPEISVTIIGNGSVVVSDFRPTIPKGVSVSASTGTQTELTEAIPLEAGATKKTNGIHLAVSTIQSGTKWKTATFHDGLERSATALSWDPRAMRMPTDFNHERSTVILQRSNTQHNGGFANFNKFKNMRNRGKIVVQESPSREASPETLDLDVEHNHPLSQSSPEPVTFSPDSESETFCDPDLEPKQILLQPPSPENTPNLVRKETPRVQHISCSIPEAQRVTYFDNINDSHKSHYRGDESTGTKKKRRRKKHRHHKTKATQKIVG